MFNLYAAGSTTPEATDFKRKIGYNQLLSQYTEKKAILGWVEYLRANPDCKCKLFIDSGAFTAHTKGVEIDTDEYINFLNDIDDCVTVAAQLDTIAGVRGQEVTMEQQLEAPKKSWDNYLYMISKLKSPHKLLPVFHQGDDFKWLETMLEYTHEDGSHIRYIGISPNKSLNTKTWKPWLSSVFSMIKKSSNPNVCTHAFGITTLFLLEQFPFTSSDSTTWLKLASYGSILVDGRPVCVSNRQRLNDKFILNRSKAFIDGVNERCAKIGISLDELLDEDDRVAGINREKFNLSFYKDWADNYTYKGTDIEKTTLW